MDESQVEQKIEEKDEWTRANKSGKQRKKADEREQRGAESRGKRRTDDSRAERNVEKEDYKARGKKPIAIQQTENNGVRNSTHLSPFGFTQKC